jgi:Ran-binding protein 3
VTTGEEDEETCYSMRAKLYTLHDGNSWKERGTGTLKVNVRRADGAGARLVMRKEAVHSLILNVSLFQGMNFSTAQDPRYIRFSAIEDGTTTHYNLRVSFIVRISCRYAKLRVQVANGKIVQEFLAEVRMNVPTS